MKLIEPRPDHAANDLAYVLLTDSVRLGNVPLPFSTRGSTAYGSNGILRQLGHTVALSSVVASVEKLVAFIRALISPRKVSGIAAGRIPAEVPRLVSVGGWPTRFLEDDAMRVRDSESAFPEANAAVPFEAVAHERPALVRAALVDLRPEPFMQTHATGYCSKPGQEN